ncbi:hypothetical protein PITCH_A890044 [uncultured Desulfobacterium sp.]|uniref:Uncharacterized protein n=1 Tax=uncultured Desulfobacterium sp. TaxID=201089 RepID=A0A445N3Q1_9BACT|nr:hypothetical protein PITCH_A890044 [uncultured Desulfobacterium sp.]
MAGVGGMGLKSDAQLSCCSPTQIAPQPYKASTEDDQSLNTLIRIRFFILTAMWVSGILN